MASRTTAPRAGAMRAARTPFKSESVSFGHDLAGTINQTPRGFEIFDADGKYLHTEMSLQAARRALYERAAGQVGSAA